MKIAIDGGALTKDKNKQFGNYTFATNIIRALKTYDKNNKYIIYTFDNLKPKYLWLKFRVSIEEILQKNDVFLALNQALPLYTRGIKICFCHGLSYYFYKSLYSQNDYVRLSKQLNEMIKISDYIIVSSLKIKKELLTINRSINNKIVVLPFGVPSDILKVKKFKGLKVKKYFLFVGMNHPIKNIKFIKSAFNKFKQDYKAKDYELKIITHKCSRPMLNRLYLNAEALLTASFYESYNFPVVEALSLGTPVVGLKSAIIPEHKKFVNIANNKEEFVKLMKTLPKKPDKDSIKSLAYEFSWKDYVKQLIRLFKV